MSTLYSHPHITTNIYDNSEVTTPTNNTDIPVLFQPYFSERGVSNKIELYSNLTSFIADKGTPNFKKYGQAQYNIVNWLTNGGRILGVRLVAEDATYANIALNVKTRPARKPDLECDTYAWDKETAIKYEKDGNPVDGINEVYKAVVKTTGRATSIQGINENSGDAVLVVATNGADLDNVIVTVNGKEVTVIKDAATINIKLSDLTCKYNDIVFTESESETGKLYVYNANGDDTLSGEVEVKLETVFLQNLTSNDNTFVKEAVAKYEAELDEAEKDTEYKNHILVVFIADGAGSYGNNYSVKISDNPGYNRNYDFACHSITLLETSKDGSVKNLIGPVGFSFYPEAISTTNLSLNIEGIIKKYFSNISCFYNEEAYDKIVDSIVEYSGNAIEDPAGIDLINGNEGIFTVDNSSITALVSNYSGSLMEQGSDGSLSNLKYTDDKFAKIRGEYTDPETGKIQRGLLTNIFETNTKLATFPELLDTKRHYIDVVLDFNASDDIKEKMQNFVQERGDCVLLLDTSDKSTPEEVIEWKNNSLTSIATDEKSYLTSIWSQYLTKYDTYSASTIGLTATNYLAQIIPSNDLNNGIQYPFVGPNRGVITDFDAINWLPTDTEKNSLYEAKINYIEESFGTTKFNSQLTVQSKTTALSDVNHVRALLKIVRSTEELVEGYLFESATTDTISSINTVLNNKLADWVSNGTCESCTAECSQTDLEAENKTAHVTIQIVFTDVIEKIVIDINVSR